jgi:hypothetical protein
MANTFVQTTVGSAADYGNVNRWILLIATVICWASQFAFMAVWLPPHWKGAMALFMLGFITYGLTLVFYASVFPRLARNTAKTKNARRKLDEGEIDTHEYELVEMLERNRLSSISTVHSNWGYLITLLLALSLLLPSPIKDDPKVNNYVLVLTNAYWVIVGLPWFFMQKNRPGPSLPKGAHWATIGWKQIWTALMQYRRLPYTFIYLFSFFLLADGLNTTGTMVGIVQNKHVEFSFLVNTYLGITQACCSIISCYAFWYIQRWRALPTKRMFQVTNVVTIVSRRQLPREHGANIVQFIPFWGMLGLWSNKVGFHNTWEFYAYNVSASLSCCRTSNSQRSCSDSAKPLTTPTRRPSCPTSAPPVSKAVSCISSRFEHLFLTPSQCSSACSESQTAHPPLSAPTSAQPSLIRAETSGTPSSSCSSSVSSLRLSSHSSSMSTRAVRKPLRSPSSSVVSLVM